MINNASAINLSKTEDIDMKKFDLMNQINLRGTFMVSKYSIKYLKNSENPHIINLSPPLTLKPEWFGKHCAYTIAKYGMSMCVLGLAEELKPLGKFEISKKFLKLEKKIFLWIIFKVLELMLYGQKQQYLLLQLIIY